MDEKGNYNVADVSWGVFTNAVNCYPIMEAVVFLNFNNVSGNNRYNFLIFVYSVLQYFKRNKKFVSYFKQTKTQKV